jgi:hypothetical protein
MLRPQPVLATKREEKEGQAGLRRSLPQSAGSVTCKTPAPRFTRSGTWKFTYTGLMYHTGASTPSSCTRVPSSETGMMLPEKSAGVHSRWL